MGGIDTDQDIADGGLAWNDVAVVFVTASETFSGLRAEAEKLRRATHGSPQAATYQRVSPILGKEPR
jgi:hypothetical protein